MATNEEARKRRKVEEDKGVGEKALKWAEEFNALEEDDQYTYLEELAPRMTKMHLQFLQGIIGFDDDDDEGEEEFGEDDEGEEGEEDEGEGEDDA
mmetsp:Transcript_75463/g.125824  ORF Transcript_75463/g.125824 Transcript_75463/m.125824 type:complete len:95 (+) Transcript_75463:32-316(+)